MIIHCDGKEIYTLSPTHMKVLRNDIMDEDFQEDIERRIILAIKNKYESCFERLKQVWMPIIQNRYASLPTDPDSIAEIIFAQPDYKTRTVREREAKNT